MATISSDPRFQLARALLSGQGSDNDVSGGDDRDGGSGRGGAEAAIDIFATLLEKSREKDETSLNAALCQYEYGNALFRAVVRKKELLVNNDVDGEDVDGEGKQDVKDKKSAAKKESQREIMAAAALKRSAVGGDSTSSCGKRVKIGHDSSNNDAGLKRGDEVHSKNNIDGKLSSENDKVAESKNNDDGSGDNDDEDDLVLALEMMETSFSILLSHATNEDSSTKNEKNKWTLEQLPRILVCIGDLYSFRGQFGNAVDAYCRALHYREEAWNILKQAHTENSGKIESLTLEDLRCQRHLVETYALITEALLACPEGDHVRCDYDDDNGKGEISVLVAKGSKGGNGAEVMKGRVLVPAKERMNFAESHYEMAREGLDELVYRMGKMKAAKMEIGNEKKDICYLVMMVLGIGNSIKDEH